MDRDKSLTRQRQMVYDAVIRANSHPTAADIIERLREQGHRISYATVYNSLRYLTEHGYLHELKVGDGVSRYDARTEPHHHIVCDVCGRVDEVFSALPQSFLDSIRNSSDYQLTDVDLILHGICASCRSQTPSDQTGSAGTHSH